MNAAIESDVVAPDAENLLVATEAGLVSLPESTAGTIEIQSATEGLDVSVSLPHELAPQGSEAVVSPDGSVAYVHPLQPDAVVQVLDESIRVMTVIENSSQSNTFTYDFGPGAYAEVNDDGSASVFQTTVLPEGDVIDIEVASVSAPWALDASGNPVATSYSTNAEGYLIQTVDLPEDSRAYPVVADPQTTLINPFQVRIRWNRAETATIAAGGWAATGATAVCIAAGAAVGGPPAAAAAGALCLAVTASAVYTAGVAENSRPKRCLQLTMTFTVVTAPVPWFDTYTGGFCQ